MDHTDLLSIIGYARYTDVLNLSGSGLTRLPPEIGELTHLTRLSLKNNHLTSLPPEIGKLTHLRELWLDDNRLTSLPPELGRLTRLRWLSLRNNQLRELPESIADLSGLEMLELGGNPLPEAVLRRGGIPGEMVAALLSQQTSNRLNDIRLLVLGDPGAGKSALVRRLIERRFSSAALPLAEGPLRWSIAAGPRRLQLSVWDFTAADIHTGLYRMHLTMRCGYLVVWDAAGSRPPERLEAWLNEIRHAAPAAPVVVALTRIDLGSAEINRKDLQERFPAIAAFVNVSAKNESGLLQLREALGAALQRLPQLSSRWEPGWVNIRTRLEVSTRDVLSIGDFRQMAEREGITAESAERLLEWLNDLGVLRRFGDAPRLAHLILRNLTGLNARLRDVLTMAEPPPVPPVAPEGELLDRLAGAGLGGPLAVSLLDLLEHLGLLRRLPESRPVRYLVLPWIQTGRYGGPWPISRSIRLEYRYREWPALTGDLMTALYDLVDWEGSSRDILMLADRHNRARVTGQADRRTLGIAVTGRPATRRAFLGIIRHAVLRLHRRLEIRAEEGVPVGDRNPLLIGYEQLLRLEAAGVTRIHAASATEPLRVGDLLWGPDSGDRFQRIRQRELLRELTVLNGRIERWWLDMARIEDAGAEAGLESRIRKGEAQREAKMAELREMTAAAGTDRS